MKALVRMFALGCSLPAAFTVAAEDALVRVAL